MWIHERPLSSEALCSNWISGWWMRHVVCPLVGLHSPSPWSGSPSRCRSSRRSRRSGGTGPDPSGCGPATCPLTFSAHGTCGEKEQVEFFFVLRFDICVSAFHVLGWKKEWKKKHLKFILLPSVCTWQLKLSPKGLDICGLNTAVSMRCGMIASVSCYQSAGEDSTHCSVPQRCKKKKEKNPMELSGPPTSVFYNKLARVSCEEQRCHLKSCEKRQNDHLTLKLWGIRRDVKNGLLRNVRIFFSFFPVPAVVLGGCFFTCLETC